MEIPVSFAPEPVVVNEEVIGMAAAMAKEQDGKVLAIVPATKPCFYKLWSVMAECQEQQVPYIILNTGQHYDDLLGHGLKEFDFKVGIDLQIRGDLSQKSAEFFIKIQALKEYLQKHYPGVHLFPFVNGDTLTAGMFPAAWMFAFNTKCIQGEAGLRGMAPKSFYHLKGEMQKDNTEVESFIREQFSGEWDLLRHEPFPEQWDTFVSAAGCEFLFAPVLLNHDHLEREGYPSNRIWTVGNTVVDAIQLKKKQRPEESVFSVYPELEEGEWLRCDIHRRGNLTPTRLKAIVQCMKELVEKGEQVCFIEMTATKRAFAHYDMQPILDKLCEEKNFLYTPLWKEYGHVIEFLQSKKCWGILTDSGSMQEELNELGKPCMTARFNTDRPETVMDAGTNVLVPPIDGAFMQKVVAEVRNNEDLYKLMSKGNKLYGHDVGGKTVDIIKREIFGQAYRPFSWSHEALGLWDEKDNDLHYL